MKSKKAAIKRRKTKKPARSQKKRAKVWLGNRRAKQKRLLLAKKLAKPKAAVQQALPLPKTSPEESAKLLKQLYNKAAERGFATEAEILHA